MPKYNMNTARINLLIFLLFLTILIGSAAFQIGLNRQSARTTCYMMIDQVEEVIASNDKDIAVLMETLKEEYSLRVQLISELIGSRIGEGLTTEDYRALAPHVTVDEIHLFDSTGTIISGTNPEYIGYSFDSGEQMGFFKPMLTDRSLVLCQDVTPNTAEGKPMMYAMTWTADGQYMVEIGVEPNRLLEAMDANDISHIITDMPVTDGMLLCILDAETGEVVGCTRNGRDDSAAYVSALLERGVQPTTERTYETLPIGGTYYYLAAERFAAYDITVAYSSAVVNSSLIITVSALFLTLFASFLLIFLVTSRTIGALEASRNELRDARDAAERANAAKTNFLSRMSHDIRTPLNGILGIIRLDEMHPDDLALITANRAKAAAAADHLLSLINDVLQMSKLEDGHFTLAHEAMDLRDLARGVMAILEPRAADSGIAMLYPPDPAAILCPYVYGSPLHLRQIFLNLYGNCIKYNRPGGSVSTQFSTIRMDDTTVVYRWVISDTGIGMSEEFLGHIFEPFAQERSDARSVYKGTGLGMSIVKTLIDKMNGSIEVASTVGVGTSFTVTLPFERADKAAVPSKDPPPQGASIRGLRLLLAEDNDLNAEIVRTMLEDEGAQVTLVENGQELVERFSAAPADTFDAILTDIMMPVMDGIAAARAIRALPRSDAADIPIIALTANAFDEDAKRCLDAGMNAHLSKPLRLEQLTATIAQCCRAADGIG